MATSLLFKGSEKSETDDTKLEMFANTNKEIYISIEGYAFSFICLDKEDAIKLSKELKKQINILNQMS